MDTSTYPNASYYLMGDDNLIRQVVDLRNELHGQRAFGSGLRSNDAARIGALLGHVSARLAAQRERVIEGEEPIWPSREFVRGLLDEVQAQHGIPDELTPPLADDPP